MSAHGAGNVLFLCTGNSARSILAECIGNHLAPPGWRCYSAGSSPTGAVNPGALAELENRGHATAGYRSKSWEEFTRADAPALDWVITLCERAASETCPVFPGAFQRAHWGMPDPATGAAAFDETYDRLTARIAEFFAAIRSA